MKDEAFNIYQTKLNKLLGKLENFEVWKEKDKLIKFVFEQAKWFQQYELDKQAVGKLLDTGGRLVGAYAYLEAKAAEKMVIAKLSELACKEVRDSLMIALKSDTVTVTEARARAQSQVQEAELDVALKELEAKRYHAATQGAVNMTIMIQSVLKSKGYEHTQTKFQTETPPI